MSTLNLIPDLELLTVHAGLFLANIWVVKKLIFEPYIKMRDKRAGLTVEMTAQAKADLAEVQKENQVLDELLAKELTAYKNEKAEILAVEKAKKEQAVLLAKEHAKEAIKASLAEVMKEKEKKEAEILNLAGEVAKGLEKKLSQDFA